MWAWIEKKVDTVNLDKNKIIEYGKYLNSVCF